MQSLTDYPPWNMETDDLREKFILIMEHELIFGEFCWSLLLVKALKRGWKVKLLALKQSKSHFNALLKKHGLDLTKLESNGTLIIKNLTAENMSEDNIWDAMSTDVISSSSFDGCTALFIDSLDCLEILGPSQSSARHFLSSCWKSFECVVSIGKMSTSSNSNEVKRDPELIEYCKYRADISIVINPLQSGYSAEIGGQILVSQNAVVRNCTYIFKALDSGVKCSLLST